MLFLEKLEESPNSVPDNSLNDSHLAPGVPSLESFICHCLQWEEQKMVTSH